MSNCLCGYLLYKVKRTCETRKIIKKCVRPDGLTKLRFYSLFCRPIKVHPVTYKNNYALSLISLCLYLSFSLSLSLFLSLYLSISFYLSFFLSLFLSLSLSLSFSLSPPLSLFLLLSLSLPPPIETVTLTLHTDTLPIAKPTLSIVEYSFNHKSCFSTTLRRDASWSLSN